MKISTKTKISLDEKIKLSNNVNELVSNISDNSSINFIARALK